MPRQLINIEGVDRSFGPVDVLLDINLLVQDGDRIGIVGHNGAGKTTLLNTISEQSQDVGEIEFAPGIRIAYLKTLILHQDRLHLPGLPLRDCLPLCNRDHLNKDHIIPIVIWDNIKLQYRDGGYRNLWTYT